jgi:hypothetical protein
MWKIIKSGWTMAWHQPFAVCVLFIYNLLWGLVLHSLISSIVVPLLHRYPGKELSREAVQLFWMEGQFQILKTNLIEPYLWWGLGLLLARMLLTPLLSAGVYYSMEHTQLNAGYRFVHGIRELGLSFFGLYALQMLFTLAPLYILVPKIVVAYGKYHALPALAWSVLPLVGGYMVYLFLLQIIFMYMQFGKLNGTTYRTAMKTLVRSVLPALLLASTMLLVTFAASAAIMSSAMIWAGFAALLGVQAYRLVQMFCEMWAITSQYALWNIKMDRS